MVSFATHSPLSSPHIFSFHLLYHLFAGRVETRIKDNLRFVQDGIRNLFLPPVVWKCVFMFKSAFLCKSEKLAVFSWCRQEQKGPGETGIHTITSWRKGYVGAP